MMRTDRRHVAFVAVALAAAAVCADTPNRYLNKLKQSSGITFCTEAGVAVSATAVIADKGCDVTTLEMYGDNVGWWANLDLNSWTIANTNAHSALTGPWCDSSGSVRLRAGGLSIAANDLMRFGSKTGQARFMLAESQTWRGPASGTVYGQFGIGLGNSHGNYGSCRVTAEKDLTWTFDGRIMVYLTASNDLSNVDMVVNPQARLVLMRSWSNQEYTPFLNAKSLTLKGGDTGSSIPLLTVGAQNPSTAQGATYAPNAFDDATFSPCVNLVDGASITGGTFDYGVSSLSVSGGDSAISGTVTVKKPVSIAIAGGASLRFTGTVAADAGAVVALSGGGSLAFTRNLTVPVSGGGTIVCDPGTGELVVSGDLSGFTGTIHAASGDVRIHPSAQLNPAATLTAAAGASIRVLEAADFGDYTTADGRSYYRSADGVAHPYLYQNAVNGNTYLSSARFRDVPDVENTLTWANGAVYVVDRQFSGGIGTGNGTTEMAGMIIESTATIGGNYFDGAGPLVLGERGIDIRRLDLQLNFWKGGNAFQLAEDQTWRGPAATTRSSSPARVNAGGSWNALYPTGSMTPLKDGLELVLEGDFALYVYYPSNDMRRANVTVRTPALLNLCNPGGNATYIDWCGRLNANRLTFDGCAANALSIAKGDLISPELLARKVVLANGSTFTQSGKRWTGVTLAAGGTGTSRLTGTYTLLDEVMHLEASAGSVLDLTAATFKQVQGVSAGFAATGAGTIRVAMDCLKAVTGGFAVDGPRLELIGNGNWTNSMADASGFAIESTDALRVPAEALAGYGGGTIEVTAGTLILDSVAALPQGCKVVTSGTGALMLTDATGFDADVHMGGTKNVATGDLFVTDEPRENEQLTVASGQTLHILGSGLKASSTVALADGAAICFHRAATVSAPVSIAGAASIVAAAGAEGVFAGAVSFAAAAGACEIDAVGAVVFEGGLTVPYGKALHHRRGKVTMRKTNVMMYGSYNMYAGHLLVTNCTVSSAGNGSNYVYWNLDKVDQTGDVLWEIAAGGTLSLGNNAMQYIGRSNAYESRLLLHGGSIAHYTYDPIYLCNTDSGTGQGVFEFDGGTLQSERRFVVGHKPGVSAGKAQVIWRGGLWKTGGNYPYRYTYLFDEPSDECGAEFIIAGPDCVLDLGSFQYAAALTNFQRGVSTMTGQPGAKLTVKGKAGVAANFTLLNFTPNGMALDLNPSPSADVTLVGDGNPIALGWVVPGTGGVVRCVGTASPLVADYVVPAGVAFENAYVNGGWNTGFASVTTRNVDFWDGSAYLIAPTAQGLPALDIAGAIVTAGTVTYALSPIASDPPIGKGMPLIRAAEGFAGDGVWTAANRSLERKSRVYGQDGELLFDYVPRSLRITFR